MVAVLEQRYATLCGVKLETENKIVDETPKYRTREAKINDLIHNPTF